MIAPLMFWLDFQHCCCLRLQEILLGKRVNSQKYRGPYISCLVYLLVVYTIVCLRCHEIKFKTFIFFLYKHIHREIICIDVVLYLFSPTHQK
jgi:hypothetical protein